MFPHLFIHFRWTESCSIKCWANCKAREEYPPLLISVETFSMAMLVLLGSAPCVFLKTENAQIASTENIKTSWFYPKHNTMIAVTDVGFLIIILEKKICHWKEKGAESPVFRWKIHKRMSYVGLTFSWPAKWHFTLPPPTPW